MNQEQELRSKISELVAEYYNLHFVKNPWDQQKDPVRYAGRVFDEKELQSLVDSSLDFWLTSGRYSQEFEMLFSEFLGVEYVYPVNSGSSANLVAFSTLTSHLLGKRRLKPGDEVISVAAGFPTTLNPIIQHGMVPVFVDIEIGTYNIDISKLESAISPKTKAIFLAHTLGNPYNLDAIMKLVDKYHLWLIEDCCDALGSTYQGKLVGTFGHIGTCSFYPAHHITMGEGGCVFTNDELLAKAALSIRDWGRDCYCAGGESNTCGKRFTGTYGTLPQGYDHKYVYSHIGYNLKITDMQAAIGVEQIKKLPHFIERRKQNFKAWESGFKQWENYFILPKATAGSDPSWFAYPVSVRANAIFTRTELVSYLNQHKVETRNLFGGNLIRQPAYQDVTYRISESGLTNTDFAMNNTFFLGVYPGLTQEMINYVIGLITEFIETKESET
ncbi:lipopolysaccharide biosynthesis protein RfbH [Sphaerochaeta sp.]|uniref:lipopolysaccharide biosynthesis protein RfbH n=1 Tax=Sphaerochaeta sp. TaxID=1972642 RepID=UPI002FCA0EEF